MAYDKDKYNALRSLEVPRAIALALADEDSPLGVPVLPFIPDVVDDEAVFANMFATVNQLLAELRAAGLMEEEA